MKQMNDSLSSGWEEGGGNPGKGSAHVWARKVSLLRWFILKMFVYLNRWEREKEEIKRKQEKLDDRQDYSYLNYLAFWSRSVQLSWIPQLSHLLIPKLLLDLGRSEYRYSYINYLPFWYQTVQCIPISPSDISQCSVSQKFFTILNAMNTHAMNTSTSDLNQLRSSYKPGLPDTSFE